MNSVTRKVYITMYGFEKMVSDKAAEQVGDNISHPTYMRVGEQVRSVAQLQIQEDTRCLET